jgi:hypothetical protein
MLARARTLPGGDDPRLHWILGAVEEVPLDPPYALIMGGSSLHWPNWDVAFPRFASVLRPHGVLAIVDRQMEPTPWLHELHVVMRRYTLERGDRPDLIAELERRGIFRETGRREVGPVPFEQAVEDYVNWFHSDSSFSLDRMAPAEAAAFDQEVRELVRPWSRAGVLQLAVAGSVVWGKPFSR